MMASELNKFRVWVFAFVLFAFLVSLTSSSGTSQIGGKLRKKRQACVDGTYKVDGKTCCLCGAGMWLVKHCVSQQDDRKCEPCGAGMYNSHPNFKEFCDFCTSCEHPSANLEVAEPCTPARDTKCRCKEHHYCILSDEPETCKLCHPCKVCGAEGIKVACTTTNNTICKAKTEEGNQGGIIVAIVVGVILLAVLVGLAVFCLWRHLSPTSTPPADSPAEEETLPLTDLHPHLPDIVHVIGFKDMKDIATRSNIPQATIDFCERDHPGDTEEQTLKLLQIWIEKQGMSASKNLIQILKNSNKKAKAEQVIDILNRGSSA